jgi:hypothetical protein
MHRNRQGAQSLFKVTLSRKRLLLSLLAAPWLAVARHGLPPTQVAQAESSQEHQQVEGGLPTRVVVSAIARGGKFLGDDIGGALVTIRDANTSQVLASGRTQGGSGPEDLMTIATTRAEPIPDQDAATFETTLLLDEPRLVEISAIGPLAAQGSSARATVTRWLLPGSAASDDNHVILTLDGLIVQILNPPTHFLPTTPAPLPISFQANVTMMCGCPIGPGLAWQPQDFQVTATITGPDGAQYELPLIWDAGAPDGAPSQFTGAWTAPAAGVYEATVTARQPVHDNVGVDRVTFTLT